MQFEIERKGKMKADMECLECCKKKAEGLLDQYNASEHIRKVILEETEKILAKAGEKSAPVLMAEVLSGVEKYLVISDTYDEAKQKYNQILMGRKESIIEEIEEQEDLFLAGVQCAIIGNYIDFGAMSDVNEKKLNELLENCFQITFEPKELENFRTEVLHAKKLVYITDNAGEIVLDGIFVTVLKKLNASLDICVIVRGVPVLNDATYADAQKVGLTEFVRVIPNGTDVPGTPLNEVSEEALEEIEHADLCIAKGQGNFETLHGCGRNIYYLFLCKCQLFVKKFGVERFAPILSNEKRIVQYDQK